MLEIEIISLDKDKRTTVSLDALFNTVHLLPPASAKRAGGYRLKFCVLLTRYNSKTK